MMGLNVGSVIAQLKLDSRQFDTALNSAQQKMNGFAKSMQRIGAYMTVALTTPLVFYGKKAVKAFADFDNAIIRASAVTKGMNTQMRIEMEKTALQMSRQSLFSATELAQGYFHLGQAGYTAAQSMKALPVVENFAIASSTDLETAVNYLSRTVQGLGIASEDPVKMMESMREVADAFTFASISTTAEIEDFAIAMTHAAAPALKLVNKSMEEGTAVLMAFALAGIQAEEAGTLLWTTIRDLQRANIVARNQWKKFGVDVYDTSGKMRNLADIFGDLENRFAGMSDETKKAALMMLGFQDRSLRGIQALMGFSDEIRTFENAMRSMDNLTEKVAETYKKSFSAQLTMAKNTIHSVGVEIGFYLSPIISKINDKIKEFAKWWDTLTDSSKMVFVEIGLVLTITGPLLIIFSKLVGVITVLSSGIVGLVSAVTSLTTSMVGLYVANPILLAINLAILEIIASIYILRAAWINNVNGFRENIKVLVDLFAAGFDLIANSVIGKFVTWLINESPKILKILVAPVENYVKFWGGAMNAIKGIVKGKNPIDEFLKGFADTSITKILDQYVVKPFENVITYGEIFANATKENLIALGEAVKKQFGEDAAAVISLITEKIKKMNEQFIEFLPNKDMQEVVAAIESIKKKMGEIGEVPPVPLDRWSQFLEDAKDMAERFTDVAINAFDSFADTFTDFITGAEVSWKQFTADILRMYLQALIKMQMATIMTDLGGNALMKGLVSGISSAVGGMFSPGMTGKGTADIQSTGNIQNAATEVDKWLGSASALGNVFNRGNLIPMANGGVVSRPMIAITRNRPALMGESGPEGVLPLKRDRSGRLGVRADMSSPKIENKLKIVNVMDRDQIYAAMKSSAGEKLILNVLKENGII